MKREGCFVVILGLRHVELVMLEKMVVGELVMRVLGEGPVVETRTVVIVQEIM